MTTPTPTNKPKSGHDEHMELAKRIGKQQAPAKPTIDVVVENHGSIFLFRPLTPLAQQWIEEHVSAEGFHPNWPTLVVEHRYAHDLALGMQVSGLVLR